MLFFLRPASFRRLKSKKHSSWPLTREPRRGHSLSQSKDFYEEIRIRVFRPPPSIPMESLTTIVAENLQINAVYTFGHKNPADVEGGYFVFVRVPALPRVPRAQGAPICSFRSLDFSSSGGKGSADPHSTEGDHREQMGGTRSPPWCSYTQMRAEDSHPQVQPALSSSSARVRHQITSFDAQDHETDCSR